jgi:hypothetical protein
MVEGKKQSEETLDKENSSDTNEENVMLLLLLKSIEAILENQSTIIKKLNLLIPKEENVNGDENLA